MQQILPVLERASVYFGPVSGVEAAFGRGHEAKNGGAHFGRAFREQKQQLFFDEMR